MIFDHEQRSIRILAASPLMSRGKLLVVLPAVYPLSLIIGLVAIPGGNTLLRLGLVLAAAPGLLRLGRVTRTHRRWFAVIGAYLAAMTVSSLASSSLASVDHSLALADLTRQAFLVAVGMALALALADPRARAFFAVAAAAVAVTATVIMLFLYGRYSGIPGLGPVQESFKAYAANGFDVPVNAVSFAAVLAAGMAVPYLVRRRATLIVLVPVAAAIAISGSRTTVVSLIAAVPLTALLLLHRRGRIPMWVPYGSLAVIATWAGITFGSQLGRFAVSPALSDLTTGRSLLWSAAWQKFLVQPLFGWGGGSFPAELGSFLPAVGVYNAEDLRILNTTGGAHNALLTTLAERGVIAAGAAALVSVFLLWLAVRVFRARHRLEGVDRTFGLLAPFFVVLILVRSLGELPGWFGYADSLVDFLAYGCAAMLVAVAASLDPSPSADPIAKPLQTRFVSA